MLPQLDSCARVHLGKQRRISSYFALGVAGTLLGAATVTSLVVASGQPVRLAVIVIASSTTSFVGGVKVMQILLGHERLVLYELFLASLAVTALALRASGQSMLPGLDLAVIGIGTMLVFGRLGCLHVGCCHGRPSRWGIVYRADHARAGFTPCYVGVRLFPVQLIESLLTVAIVAAAVAAFMRSRPGQAMCLYASLYGTARFGLEILRGDDDRPHAGGISEAQWIALATTWAAAWGGYAWALPLAGLHIAAPIVVSALTIVLIVADRAGPRRRWWFRHPDRLRELAVALRQLVADADQRVRVVDTPSGLRLSCSRDGSDLLVGISFPSHALSISTARAIAQQARALTGLPLGEPAAGHAVGFFHVRAHGPTDDAIRRQSA